MLADIFTVGLWLPVFTLSPFSSTARFPGDRRHSALTMWAFPLSTALTVLMVVMVLVMVSPLEGAVFR